MPYERFEGPRHIPAENAEDVVEALGMPFTAFSVKRVGDNSFYAVVEHPSSGLEPLFMSGSAVRTNGETDEVLKIRALTEAAGLDGQSVTLREYYSGSHEETVVKLTDQEGTVWQAKGASFDDATRTNLAAVLQTRK